MKKCVKNDKECIDRDSREYDDVLECPICCLEEVKDEIEIVENIIDAIYDYEKNKHDISAISSKLSYAASTINKNDDQELDLVLGIVKHFSLLLHQFEEKITSDTTISELTYSFTTELQKWFSQHFLNESNILNDEINLPSIIADMNTLEMALGVCIADHSSECLDDIFF